MAISGALLGWLLLASGSATVAAPMLPAWMQASPVRPGTEAMAAWQAMADADAASVAATPEIEKQINSILGLPPPVEFFGAGMIHRQQADGEHAGHWWFIGNEGETSPKAGIRLTLPETPPYVVRAELFCDEAAGDCAPLRQHLVEMPAPFPAHPSLVEEWLRIVQAQPCEHGPARMPTPPYPSRALRYRAAGTVQLTAFHDTCGNLVHAMVRRTSGHRDLDNAALQGVRGWRFAVATDGSATGIVTFPIRFHFGSATPTD